jgi:hypothetical protein
VPILVILWSENAKTPQLSAAGQSFNYAGGRPAERISVMSNLHEEPPHGKQHGKWRGYANGTDGTESDNRNHSTEGSRLTDDHQRQMARRGIKLETAEAAGLWSATAEQVADILGFNPKSGGIVFPYFHPLTGHVMLNRVRPDNPPVINGKAAKYLSPKGAANHFYFPPDASAWIGDSSVPIGLTEGEFKVLWAHQVGMRYVGTIGVSGYRGKDDHGVSGPIADFDFIAWRDRIGTLCPDSDVTTNEHVRTAFSGLAIEIHRRGARFVYRVTLPPDATGDKNGLDDFLHINGVEAFLDLDAEEIPSPFPKVKLLTGTELLATAIERPPAIVQGWGIRRGGKVILTGAGGRGKSTLLLQLASNLVAGMPLLGFGALSVNGPQRVAVLMSEDPLSEVKFRWQHQMEALRYGPEVADRLAFLNLQGARMSLGDDMGRQALFDALRLHRADIAFLDPLVALHDSDENSNAAMRWVLDRLSPLQEETGCSFWIAHHEPKSPENNSAASRGASAIRDWCRTMLRLTAGKPGPDGSQRFQLDLDKSNYGGSVWQLILERKRDSYLFAAIESEAIVTPRDIWELLGATGMWLADAKTEIGERFGVSEPTARRALKKTIEMGLAVEGKRLNTETGREKAYLIRGQGPKVENEDV